MILSSLMWQWGIKMNKFASKQRDTLVSKYPESFVKIEVMDRKKIIIYYCVMQSPTAKE